MNMLESVQSVFGKYVDFAGRARRSEYWWFFLFNAIVGIIVSLLDRAIGTPILAILVFLGTFLPGLAVGIRRLHDTSRSGWWILIALIPIVGAIILLVFFCQDTKPGENQYGAPPK